MAIAKLEFRPNKAKLTNMDHVILEKAKQKIVEGADRNFLRLFLEEEINDWKKRDRYRTSETHLEYRSQWEMALMNGKTELAVIKTLIF